MFSLGDKQRRSIKLILALIILKFIGEALWFSERSVAAEVRPSSFCPGYRRFIAEVNKSPLVLHFHCFVRAQKYAVTLVYQLPGLPPNQATQIQPASIDVNGNLASLVEQGPAIRGQIAIAAAFPKMRHQLKAQLTVPSAWANLAQAKLAHGPKGTSQYQVLFKEDYESLGGAVRFSIDSQSKRASEMNKETGKGVEKGAGNDPVKSKEGVPASLPQRCFNQWLEPESSVRDWLMTGEYWKDFQYKCDGDQIAHFKFNLAGKGPYDSIVMSRLVVFNQFGVLVLRDHHSLNSDHQPLNGRAVATHTNYLWYDLTRRFQLTLAKHIIAAGKENGFWKLVNNGFPPAGQASPVKSNDPNAFTVLPSPEGLWVQTRRQAQGEKFSSGAFLPWSKLWPFVSRQSKRSLKPLLLISQQPANQQLCRSVKFCP